MGYRFHIVPPHSCEGAYSATYRDRIAAENARRDMIRHYRGAGQIGDIEAAPSA
jgi:hypothetical protein